MLHSCRTGSRLSEDQSRGDWVLAHGTRDALGDLHDMRAVRT